MESIVYCVAYCNSLFNRSGCTFELPLAGPWPCVTSRKETVPFPVKELVGQKSKLDHNGMSLLRKCDDSEFCQLFCSIRSMIVEQ